MAQMMVAGTKEATKQEKKFSIILSKGSLDMTYPAFMLANAGAAMGVEVHIFFTFWGLAVVDKRKVGSLKVSPVGNPGLSMPNILGMIPGMTRVATRAMKGKVRELKIPSIPEMIVSAKEMGVHLHACSTSMGMLGMKKEDLVPEVEDIVGAASFLHLAEGGQTIFI